jgi:hypothetical protein
MPAGRPGFMAAQGDQPHLPEGGNEAKNSQRKFTLAPIVFGTAFGWSVVVYFPRLSPIVRRLA